MVGIKIKYKECWINGKLSETFVSKLLLKAKGGTVTNATEMTDIHDHIDIWWNPDIETDECIGIDVKGMRKVCRNDDRPSNIYTWLETKNVLGRNGWVYGKAKFIAFIREYKVLFVEREKLIPYIEGKIANKTVVIRDKQQSECFVPYTRVGKKDVIVLVPLDELEELSTFIIPFTDNDL